MRLKDHARASSESTPIVMMAWVSWLAWNIGRHPTRQQTLNRMASGFQYEGSASRMTYIGPPWISPAESFPRYMTERALVKKLVDMPTRAVTHIQNSAPGPPRAMATATPAMLPIPTVDASAVESASYGLT